MPRFISTFLVDLYYQSYYFLFYTGRTATFYQQHSFALIKTRYLLVDSKYPTYLAGTTVLRLVPSTLRSASVSRRAYSFTLKFVVTSVLETFIIQTPLCRLPIEPFFLPLYHLPYPISIQLELQKHPALHFSRHTAYYKPVCFFSFSATYLIISTINTA